MYKKSLFWRMVLFVTGFYGVVATLRDYTDHAMILSFSSDGRYVISSHRNQKIILWDIFHKTSEVISRHANVYSAYFIPKTHRYLWQDLEDQVHVKSVEEKEVLSFGNFPVYGHKMSEDYRYYAVNQAWDLYRGWGIHQVKLNHSPARASFLSYAKCLDLLISSRGLFTAGVGLTFWQDHEPRRMGDHHGQTVIALSPDEKWLISGDANNAIWKWDLEHPEERVPWNTWTLHWPSWGGANALRYKIHAIVALKFIDQRHCLCFIRDLYHYVLLFDTEGGSEPQYLYVSKSLPVHNYLQAQAIDTAPSAHLLSYAWKNGLVLYKYSEQKSSLMFLWSAQGSLR